MKKSTLRLLKALFTVNNDRRPFAVKIAVFAALLCGMSSVGYAQSVTINVTTPTTIASENVCPGTANVNIYAFTLTGTTTGTTNTVTAIAIPIAGATTATSPGDIIQYKLWSGSGGGAGTLLGTIPATGSIFFGLLEAFNNGTSTNYWITADFAATPTAGDFLQLNNTSAINFIASGGISSVTAGATSGANTQTIRALPTVGGITATPTPLCAGATLHLAATGGTTGTGTLVSYNWAGPGPYSSSTVGNTQSYVTPPAGASGSYSVTVTYPGAGCTSLPQSSIPVTVNPQPVLPATMFICNNVPMVPFGYTQLNSSVPGGNWSSGNNLVATVEAATGNVWATGAPGTTTTITQVAATGGCTATTTITIATRPSGIVGPINIVGHAQAVCSGSTITLSSGTSGGVWSSGFTNIATVVAGTSSNIGLVTGSAIAPLSGSTTVFYTNPLNGCDTSVEIDVNPTPYAITPQPDSVCVGSTVHLTDITDGTTTSTWSSSAILTATVTAGPGITGGYVTGLSAGTAIITYQVVTTGCYVTESMRVDPLPLAIVGTNYLCTGADTTLSDGTPGGTWSSQTPGVATILLNTPTLGGVTGGSTTIFYTLIATGCSVAHALHVNPQPDPINGPIVVCAGDMILLTDAVGGGTWSSITSSVAIVDSTTGIVTGQHAGPVDRVDTIIYNLTSCMAQTYTVTVHPGPGPITGVPNVCVGFLVTLSDTTAGGTWSNSNTAAPFIDSFTTAPTIRGISTGFSIITYTLPTTCYVLDTFLVNPNPARIIGADTVCQGASVTLSDRTPGGTWSSTVLSTAAVVDSSGVVTGITAGGVHISYTLPTGCWAQDSFTVKPPVVASVTISKSPAGLTCQGTDVTFTANPVNGGIPTYQWYKFVTPEVTTQTYGYVPLVGDVLTVKMTTHFSCAIDTVVYDSLAANVYPNSGVIVDVTVSPSSTTATFIGEVFTFFANVTYGGTSPTYQWYSDGVAIPGANSSSYTTPVYVDESFYCVVNGNPPCDAGPTSSKSNTINIFATYLGVNQVQSPTSNLSLFPNPSNGNVILSGSVSANSGNDLDIEVSDMLGHIVYKGKTAPQNGSVKEQLNMQGLAGGTYLLHVYSATVNQVFHFVINK